MSRPEHEVADIISRFGDSFITRHQPNPYQLRVLRALSMCRTSVLGGHKYRCDHCGREHISYNSCRNRHCPKCQTTKQAFWVEDRIRKAYPVRHYHIVFTVPEALNEICITDSKIVFSLKDYRDQGRHKTTSLSGEEFLRRFCLHILPRGFVKIRHYGIYILRFMATVLKSNARMVVEQVETTAERINRLTGVDLACCPYCRKGRLIPAGVIPRSRSPTLPSLYSFIMQSSIPA